MTRHVGGGRSARASGARFWARMRVGARALGSSAQTRRAARSVENAAEERGGAIAHRTWAHCRRISFFGMAPE